MFKDGHIEQEEKAGENKIVIMDENNQKTENTVNIGDDARLTEVKVDGKTTQTLEISDQSKAKEAFKTIAENTTKEFGLINYDSSNGNKNAAIVSERNEATMNKLVPLAMTSYNSNGNSVTDIIHNHPGDSPPSGYDPGTSIKIKNTVKTDGATATAHPTNSKGNKINYGVYKPGFKTINSYDEKRFQSGIPY